ncbi:MAG TPA: hypothetical protein DHW85_04255 [Lachnospiraceae bacterium]|mgnify:FL=1|jgi:hypothetical protein|nr:hypothetical protein [Lachnospiraceae bacterium]
MNIVDEEKILELASTAATSETEVGAMGGGEFLDGEEMNGDPGMETGMAEVKDPQLSSWPFVIGISGAVLIVSVALGAFLASRKIKKGIDLYED